MITCPALCLSKIEYLWMKDTVVLLMYLPVQLLDSFADVVPYEVQDLHVVQRDIAEPFTELPGVEDIGITVPPMGIDDVDIRVSEDEHGYDPCNIAQGLPVDVGVFELGMDHRTPADLRLKGESALCSVGRLLEHGQAESDAPDLLGGVKGVQGLLHGLRVHALAVVLDLQGKDIALTRSSAMVISMRLAWARDEFSAISRTCRASSSMIYSRTYLPICLESASFISGKAGPSRNMRVDALPISVT